MMEEVLGVSLDSKEGFESVEEMPHEGLRQAQDKARAKAERQAGRKLGKRQQEAEQAQ